jgi:hypothetical protein
VPLNSRGWKSSRSYRSRPIRHRNRVQTSRRTPRAEPGRRHISSYAARSILCGSARIRSIGRYLPTASMCSADASESRIPARSVTLRRSRERPRIRSEDYSLHDGSCQWRGHLRIEIRSGGARRYGHTDGQRQRDEHSTHDSILFLRGTYNATSHVARFKAAIMQFWNRRGGRGFILASRTHSWQRWAPAAARTARAPGSRPRRAGDGRRCADRSPDSSRIPASSAARMVGDHSMPPTPTVDDELRLDTRLGRP